MLLQTGRGRKKGLVESRVYQERRNVLKREQIQALETFFTSNFSVMCWLTFSGLDEDGFVQIHVSP
jgi:hypothetical protein